MVCCVAANQIQSVSYRVAMGRYTVYFDPAKISEEQLKTLVIFSPYIVGDTDAPIPKGLIAQGSQVGRTLDKSLVAIPLERCLKTNPDYIHCDNNSVESPNFLRNAEVNLKKAKEGLEWLDHLAHPRDLDPVLSYVRELLSASIWIEETRLKYYRSWDASVLKEPHADLQPARSCETALRKIESADSTGEKYKIAAYDWAGCVNAMADMSYAHRYPIESWKSFLAAYGLKELYKDDGPD